jgi:hypothetical protein
MLDYCSGEELSPFHYRSSPGRERGGEMAAAVRLCPHDG